MSQSEAATILKQLLSALAHMHKNKIVHRDLKPENVLLENEDDINNVKLIDFGTACMFGERKLYDRVGTVMYMAPEVISASREQNIGYDQSCDMWSIGIISYVLLIGDFPFQSEDKKLIK